MNFLQWWARLHSAIPLHVTFLGVDGPSKSSFSRNMNMAVDLQRSRYPDLVSLRYCMCPEEVRTSNDKAVEHCCLFKLPKQEQKHGAHASQKYKREEAREQRRLKMAWRQRQEEARRRKEESRRSREEERRRREATAELRRINEDPPDEIALQFLDGLDSALISPGHTEICARFRPRREDGHEDVYDDGDEYGDERSDENRYTYQYRHAATIREVSGGEGW